MTERRLEWITYVVVAIYFAATIASYGQPAGRKAIGGYLFLGIVWPLTGSTMVINALSGFPLDARIHPNETSTE